MSNTECRYLCSPDILVVPGCTKYTVKIDFSTVEGDVVRAGTPISRDGKVANDATAFGILLRDTWRQSPYAKICIDGFIDLTLAQEHSCITLSDEAKAVMKIKYEHRGDLNWVKSENVNLYIYLGLYTLMACG